VDSTDLLVLAVASIAAVAWAASRTAASVLGYLRERAARRNPPPAKPVCGCGHDVAFHEPHGGPCHQVELRTVMEQRPVRDEQDRPLQNAYGYFQTCDTLVEVCRELCHCLGYRGPELPEARVPALVLPRETAQR
jgi:hypothetical protein